mgnify:CR=1 FL=1
MMTAILAAILDFSDLLKMLNIFYLAFIGFAKDS